MGEADPTMKPRRLICAVQNYDWGRKGEDSSVARLSAKNSGSAVDGGKPYAELWMGTHPSGPSFLVAAAVDAGEALGEEKKGVPLKQWIEENPPVLGKKVVERWGGDLPFLFKVLSVAKALSIQAHPDKELARKLHEQQPSVYKDDNHKPEMALALTEFQALCGFVSLEELKDVLIKVPEIAELVGDEEIGNVLGIKEQGESDKLILRSIFTKLMSASKDVVSDTISKLKGRLSRESKVRTLTEKEALALVLENQYPADVGVLSCFFLNYVKLSPGEALYLGANEPHAYLSGDCIECMATSDNVVRAGLTPKYVDVQTLCSMLTYKQGFPEILRAIPLNTYISRYIPPFEEFEVDHCSLPSEKSLVLPAIPGPSIFLVVAGEGKMQVTSGVSEEVIREGHIFFVPAGIEISLSAGSGGALQLYRAGVNSRFFE
ncbi:hypothetical protein Taro_031748 [Colocasia esculenta]|uniref:Mannose-6-phosphate isomerase n=1 Tax=Colocasia esculenta TaxID=4460 RepID=A0A843VJL6_COLES|nr:hypothetical protein [Colocasia esculenta]